ncbi:double-strand break repair protein mre11a [Vairimorpha apis BRL 01]|uniref:Double-strand break repair protein mre11a n=1 Tax=Vairimorpha apis BRL 01 TaxID=1037528 RepID=T0KZ35_9MICR|nr:double-strand break repair protein mre11a [Vairimorpha apis BRL 01]
MRILITSDNHLGYKETDFERTNDTFNTFNEILQISKHFNCDLILQVGDLFHDNRPSRYCLNKTIKLLISNKIPFIAIHGNHDDPSGINFVSVLDILQSAGLIMYVGKFCGIINGMNMRDGMNGDGEGINGDEDNKCIDENRDDRNIELIKNKNYLNNINLNTDNK